MRSVRSVSVIVLILLVGLAGLWPTPALANDPAVAELDYRAFGLGLLPFVGDAPKLDVSGLGLATGLPSAIDLSADLPPVASQGGQASCVAWALGYYSKTYQERVERSWDVTSRDRQFSPAWIYNQRPTSNCQVDAGMTFWDGLSLLRDGGAATWTTFPYNASDRCTQPSQSVVDQAWDYRIDGFARVFSGAGEADIATLKGLLAAGQPFAIGVPVYDSFYDVSASSPIVPRHQPDETLWGGHAMFVVGYDDARGGFQTVNSWGAGWGLGGYCYLSYDFVQHDAWEAWTVQDHVEGLVSVELALRAGWNLVSLPVVPQSLGVAEVFAPIAGVLESVSAWDVEGQAWGHYAPQAPDYANSLQTLVASRGLWVRVSQDVTLSLQGAPAEDGIALTSGWNLVAYPGEAALPVDEALSSISGACDQILGYHTEDGNWRSFEPGTPVEAATLQALQPGAGYWIYVSTACTWTVV